MIVREDEQLPQLAPATSDLIDAVTDTTVPPVALVAPHGSDTEDDAPGDDDPDAGAADDLAPALA